MTAQNSGSQDAGSAGGVSYLICSSSAVRFAGAGASVGVGGGRRGLDRGGCVGGVGREMLLVRLEVAPGIVLGVTASPVIHDGLAALGARGGFRVERGGIVSFLLVMRESHGVGISRRLDARFQREHVQDQERKVMQAQAVEVEPTLLRGHLGDVGRVSQVKPPHGDDPRVPRCDARSIPERPIAFRRGSRGRYPRTDGRSYARAINADERRESSRYAHKMLNGAKVGSFGLLSARRYEISRDSPIGEEPAGVRERLKLKTAISIFIRSPPTPLGRRTRLHPARIRRRWASNSAARRT